MPLLSLPPELLFMIFRLVGARELQQDIRRLSICHRWYSFTRIILLEGLYLTVESLTDLKIRRTLAAQEYPGIQCRGLSLSLEDCEETLWQYNQDQMRHVRRTPLNLSLTRLAEGLGKEDQIKTLKFETPRPELGESILRAYSSKGKSKHRVLLTSTILNFLDLNLATSLETLHLDLANLFRTQFSPDSAHYCSPIAKLLPRLSHARIRLPRICPDCFEGHETLWQKQEDDLPKSRLRTLAVCISVGDEWCADIWPESSVSGVYSQCCRAVKAGRFMGTEQVKLAKPMRTKLIESLKSLASRSPYLQMARLLHHPQWGSSRRLVAFDCLTGKKHIMRRDDRWDAKIEVDHVISEITKSPVGGEKSSLIND